MIRLNYIKIVKIGKPRNGLIKQMKGYFYKKKVYQLDESLCFT